MPNFQVSDLGPLALHRAIEHLMVSRTLVSDLSPVSLVRHHPTMYMSIVG